MHIPNERAGNRFDVRWLLLIKAIGSRCQVANNFNNKVQSSEKTATTQKQLLDTLNGTDSKLSTVPYMYVRMNYRNVSVNTLNGTSKIPKITMQTPKITSKIQKTLQTP